MQKSRGILKMAKVKFKVCFVILFSYMYLQKIIGIENIFKETISHIESQSFVSHLSVRVQVYIQSVHIFIFLYYHVNKIKTELSIYSEDCFKISE